MPKSKSQFDLSGAPEDVAAYCRLAWKRSSPAAYSMWIDRIPEIIQAPALADDPNRPYRIADWAVREVAGVRCAPIMDAATARAAREKADYAASFAPSASAEAVYTDVRSAAAHAADTFATPPAAAADMYAASVAAYRAASSAAHAVRRSLERDALFLEGLGVLLGLPA